MAKQRAEGGERKAGVGGAADSALRLIAATNGLLRYELDVLQGAPFDEDTLDDLIAEFCAALHRAAECPADSDVVLRLPAPRERPSAPADGEPVQGATPTRRLEFARWLVRHGRLSG